MVQISCQCCLLLFASVLLAVRPTLELFVGKSREQVAERLGQQESDIDGDGEMEMHREPSFLSSLSQIQPLPAPRWNKSRRKRSAFEDRRDSIVFPDQVPGASHENSDNLQDRTFVVPNTASPPPCARGSTFCESVDEYPAEHVIKLLRKEPVFVRGFFQDERRKYSIADDDDVQDRIDTSDESPLCAAQEHTVYPKMAKNIEGNWLFVVNQDEYIQGVRVEMCLNDRECSFPASLPIGYRSKCKQKYIYRKLVALNGTGQGVISDSFQFPSCCSCVIKLDHALLQQHNRFGGSSGGSGGAPFPLPLTLPKSTPTPIKTKNKS